MKKHKDIGQYRTEGKAKSRATDVSKIRKILGQDRLSGRFLSLCGNQAATRSELRYLIDDGLIEEEQFFGVDEDARKIERNRMAWPKARWESGRLVSSVFPRIGENNGIEVLSYDGVQEAGNPDLWDQVVKASFYVPPLSLIIVNAVSKNPYDRRAISRGAMWKAVENAGLPHWVTVLENETYEYENRGTRMVKVFLHVGRKPAVHRPRVRAKRSLWGWQRTCGKALENSGKHFLVIAPCGSGKTTLLSKFAAKSSVKRKVLIVAPQTHIVKGFVSAFEKGACEDLTTSHSQESTLKSLRSFFSAKNKNLVGPKRIVVTTQQALSLCGTTETLSNLVLIIDESHHVRVDVEDVAEANKLGKVVQRVAKCRTSKVVYATATPFRGDRAPIIPGDLEDQFDKYHLTWDVWFPQTRLQEIRTGYREFRSKKNLFQMVTDSVSSELNHRHLVVVPSSTHKWRESGKEAAQFLSHIHRKCPNLRVLDLVSPEDQETNKARLLSGEEFDVVVMCKLGREGTDWVPCDRIHHTDPEQSRPMALQTLGRALRKSDGKTDVEIMYYVRNFPEKFSREDLSNHTNVIVASMVIADFLDPIKVPCASPSKQRRPKSQAIRSLLGDDRWFKNHKDLMEGVEGLGEDKTPGKVGEVITSIINANRKYAQDRGVTDEHYREALQAVLTRSHPRFGFTGTTSVTQLLRDKKFDLVWEELGWRNLSFYRGRFDGKHLERAREILGGGLEQRRKRIAELVAWMDANGRRKPSKRGKGEEERSLGNFLSELRRAKSGKGGTCVLYGFEEEEFAKAGYQNVLNGVDREQKRRDRIRELCRWMDANGRRKPSKRGKGEEERSLGNFLSELRRAKSGKRVSTVLHGFEEEEFAKAGYDGILEPRGGK